MDETVWHLIRDERLSLARMLAPLPDELWGTPSLCREWTVKDVLAHVVMTPVGEPRPWTMTAALVRARGHLWTAGRDVAVTYARRDAQDLVASLHGLAEVRTRPIFVTDDNILLDLVVHGQDIAVPLGLGRPVPDDAARFSLDRTWAMGWPFHARRRLDGAHLRCTSRSGTDVVWQAGSGAEVRGTAGDLALLMTGRTTAALPRLHGPGVEMLSRRLQPARASR